MPRPPKWNHPTEAVRLPQPAIEACLKLAAAIDRIESIEAPPDEQFARYGRFVQNLSQPKLLAIQDGSQQQRYLIQAEPPSFEDFKLIEQVIERLEERMNQEQFDEDDRLLLLSKLVEQVFEPMKGGDRDV